LICNLTANGTDLTESFDSPAATADGRLAFVAASGPRGGLLPERQELSLGSVADPATRTPLLSIPYTIPGRRTHTGISQIRWLGPSRLLYLGEAVSVFTPCQFCQKDTLRSGLDAVRLTLVGSAAGPEAIPGTDNASGVSPGSTEDEIYYTLGGDTRVYRRVLSTGAATVVHDFGGAGIARDVDVVGDRLAAVVGGRVHFIDDPSFGPTQWDSGGVVHLVTLSDGADLAVTDPAELGLYRRPRISPSGGQIVVERYPLLVEAGDTTVVRTADLFLLGQP
jgi:hypothetical protein